ncbi:hypothetical protein Hanom_Chr14g01285481 [Helianthus anomalus]
MYIFFPQACSCIARQWLITLYFSNLVNRQKCQGLKAYKQTITYAICSSICSLKHHNTFITRKMTC